MTEDHDQALSSVGLQLLGRWAAQIVKGRRVLDASSQLGPGTKEIMAAARELVVVTPRAAIAEALGSSLQPAAEVRSADLTQLPFQRNEFSAIVSFDANRHDVPLDALASEFHRVLDEREGLLAISLARDVRRLRGPGDADGEQDAMSVLRRYFDRVAIVHQYVALSAWFVPDGTGQRSGSGQSHSDAVNDDWSQEGRSIFVASRSGCDETLEARLALPVDISEWEGQLERLARLAWMYEGRAQTAHDVSLDRSRLLRELFLAEQMLERDFDSLPVGSGSGQLSDDLADQLEDAERRLAEAQRLVDDLQSTVSWKITRPLRSVRRRIG